MKVAVVGAGPSGLTAAYLLQQQGCAVEVFERTDHAGGRTRTEHFGVGHWLDTGAGWLTDFYPSSMAMVDVLALRDRLRPLQLRGGGTLLLDGKLVPSPNSIARIATSRALSVTDKARFLLWMAALIVRQPRNITPDTTFDSISAIDSLARAGRGGTEKIVRPTFEGPFFARLEEMNGTLIRSWLRNLATGSFFQIDGGMDLPWRHLAQRLTVHYSAPIQSVEAVKVGDRDPGGRDGGDSDDWSVRLLCGGKARVFDAVVLAVPAPDAATIIGPRAPAELSAVRYASHVRAYVARPASSPVERFGLHAFPNDLVATVERGYGPQGAWGRAPAGWEWALVCSPAATRMDLLNVDRDTALDEMFRQAEELSHVHLPWRDYDVAELVRWHHAVPIVDPGYYRRLERIPSRRPLVFAGDWRYQPCVEGAVRSAELAASTVLGRDVTVASTPVFPAITAARFREPAGPGGASPQDS